jgi:hypothetical protein
MLQALLGCYKEIFDHYKYNSIYGGCLGGKKEGE